MRFPLRLALIVTMVSTLFVQPATAATTYQQPIWIQGMWASTAVLNVFIVPPHHGQIVNGNGVLNGLSTSEVNPFTSSYLRAIENSVIDWQRAVNQYGSATLKAGLKITKYVLGRDPVPSGTQPQILITADENKTFILGVAVSGPRKPCLVANSMFFITSMTYEDMFNINAQEYGHCLGLGHVNEAAGQSNVADLTHDPMNGAYADNPGDAGNDLHCVSNLNVKGLEEVFKEALTGTPGGTQGSIAISSYQRPRYEGVAAPTTGCIF